MTPQAILRRRLTQFRKQGLDDFADLIVKREDALRRSLDAECRAGTPRELLTKSQSRALGFDYVVPAACRWLANGRSWKVPGKGRRRTIAFTSEPYRRDLQPVDIEAARTFADRFDLDLTVDDERSSYMPGETTLLLFRKRDVGFPEPVIVPLPDWISRSVPGKPCETEQLTNGLLRRRPQQPKGENAVKDETPTNKPAAPLQLVPAPEADVLALAPPEAKSEVPPPADFDLLAAERQVLEAREAYERAVAARAKGPTLDAVGLHLKILKLTTMAHDLSTAVNALALEFAPHMEHEIYSRPNPHDGAC